MRCLPALLSVGLVALACSRHRADQAPLDAAAADDHEDAARPPTDITMASCVDGQYREVLPALRADISDVAFSENAIEAFVLAALDARYPIGAYVVRACLGSNQRASCITPWLPDTTSRRAVLRSLPTVVHESGHLHDIAVGNNTYHIRNNLRFDCANGDTVARGGRTFARSELIADRYQSRVAVCAADEFDGCDAYARLYLVDGGARQGFNTVLQEATQYVNSLATAYAFADQYDQTERISERDGVLAFLWYLERYLQHARREHSEVYDFLLGDACWRRAVLTVWGRAWLFLEASSALSQPEVLGSQFMAEVRNPELLVEIHRVRVAEGCTR